MNIIWTIIILFSFIFALFSGNLNNLIDSIFNVPKASLALLLNLGSLIVVYNGIFQIAIDSKLINLISKLFKGIVKKVFINVNDNVIDLISADICANLLGLGVATTPIALTIMKELDIDGNINNNILSLIGINLSAFTLFPLTILTIRNNYQGAYTLSVWIIIILISFITTMFSVTLAKHWRFK